MARWKLTFEGDTYEDSDEFKMYCSAKEMYLALDDVREKVRARLKYHTITEEEDRFLDEIYPLLCAKTDL